MSGVCQLSRSSSYHDEKQKDRIDKYNDEENERFSKNLRDAFENYLPKTYGSSGRVILHMFSATHQNASKAILSIYRHLFLYSTDRKSCKSCTRLSPL